MKYEEEINKAKEQKEEIAKMFNRFKRKKPKQLDELFAVEHEKAFEEIDCLECANCCKTTSPIFRDVDIKRISKKLKISEMDFENNYLRMDEEGDWVLQSSPCTFLGSDNKCSIYEFRPQACKQYPHTDRKKMVQILDLTLRNTEVCPAVAKVVLALKK